MAISFWPHFFWPTLLVINSLDQFVRLDHCPECYNHFTLRSNLLYSSVVYLCMLLCFIYLRSE